MKNKTFISTIILFAFEVIYALNPAILPDNSAEQVMIMEIPLL